MSLKCPLCGKSKTEESLFCSDCAGKLNSEYEVRVPNTENSQNEKQNSEAESKTTQSDAEKDRAQPTTATYDKKAWKKRREDERTDSSKSYYEIEKEKKSNRFLTVTLLVVVAAIVLGVSYYIYKEQVKSDNLERSHWEVAQRQNSVDSYLTYIDNFPEGDFVDEAYEKMMVLKNKETDAWKNLMTSENREEFTSFLERYPDSPFKRKVKNRLDSLSWQSSLKENTAQSYADYIASSATKEITGDYIGEAQRRLDMLQQSSTIDDEEVEKIQGVISGFFGALSNNATEELNNYLAPLIVRFHRTTNVPSNKMIGQLLLLLAKADVASLQYDPDIAHLKYELIAGARYSVNVPAQKIVKQNDGTINQIQGYIIHIKLNADYKIYSYHETKPFATAP